MKLTIITAMEKELTAVVNQLGCTQQPNNLDFAIYRATFNQHEITVCQSGIGKVHAGVRTALMLNQYQPDWVINTGSAGGIHPEVDVEDLIMGERLCYYDVDVTHFGYHMGQLPAGMPLEFYADPSYNQLLQEAARKEDIQLKQGLIVSGDQFIADLDKTTQIQRHFPEAYVVDMESCAIAQTCYLHNTPFSVLRAVSDHANQHAPVSFYQFLDDIGAEYSRIVHRLLTDI